MKVESTGCLTRLWSDLSFIDHGKSPLIELAGLARGERQRIPTGVQVSELSNMRLNLIESSHLESARRIRIPFRKTSQQAAICIRRQHTAKSGTCNGSVKSSSQVIRLLAANSRTLSVSAASVLALTVDSIHAGIYAPRLATEIMHLGSYSDYRLFLCSPKPGSSRGTRLIAQVYREMSPTCL